MKTTFLNVLAITALLVVSCNDDNTPEVNDGMVQFSSGIEVPQLRVGGADGDEWTANDPIGIYMVENGSSTVAEGATNVEYKAASLSNGNKNATFTSTTPIYYPVSGSKVDFIAYHPYSSSVNNYVYPVNVATQTSQTAIDLMVAKADNSGIGYDKTNTSPVNLSFSHQLTKVVLNVTPGAGIADLTGLTVNIKGMNTTADFAIDNPALSNQANVADITPYDAGSYSYEAILLPVTAFAAAHVVEFTVGGNTYTWTMSDNDGNITGLAVGNKYIFNVSVQKNAVVVSGTITPWGNGGSSNGTAN